MTIKRSAWIDCLRALAMIFVIEGHLLSGVNEYFVITSPIKIPLFFAISGYLISIGKETDFKAFIIKLWKRMGIPFVAFSLLLLPVKYIALLYGPVNDPPPEVIKSFLSGDEFWYIPCVFIAEVIWFFIRKIAAKTSREKSVTVIGALCMTLRGFLTIRIPYFGFFNFNTALTAQSFLLLGSQMRAYSKKGKPTHGSWWFYLRHMRRSATCHSYFSRQVDGFT